MSLYKRERPDGTLITPYWYCEFYDLDDRDPITNKPRTVRLSTGVEISSKNEKAEELSKKKDRQQEAIVKQQYYEEKQKAQETANSKGEITFDSFCTLFLDWV